MRCVDFLFLAILIFNFQKIELGMTSGLGDHNRGSALQALDAGCEAEIVIEVKT